MTSLCVSTIRLWGAIENLKYKTHTQNYIIVTLFPNYAGRVFVTLIKVYALTVLAFLIETYIFEGLPVKLANIVAGAVCFRQVWSMLENESSCNDAKWAKIAQRILVDKTERHFEIDLSELKERRNDGES